MSKPISQMGGSRKKEEEQVDGVQPGWDSRGMVHRPEFT